MVPIDSAVGRAVKLNWWAAKTPKRIARMTAMWEPPPGHPLRRMFAGITEHAFLTTLGVADPPLIDYLALLLSRFVHTDSVYRLSDTDGRRLGELTDMVMEAERLPTEGRTRREYHRHIGDFALFWSGVF